MPILRRQVRISYFHDKCVISARNCKIADLIQLVKGSFCYSCDVSWMSSYKRNLHAELTPKPD